MKSGFWRPAALALLAAGCTHQLAQAQVNSALVDAGMPAPTARCIAHRLVDRLTVKQLRKLQALQGSKLTADDYLAAIERVNDPQVLQAAIIIAADCLKG